MIQITEWLPNPTGADANGEWIELFNSGNASVNLSGWMIKNSGKGKFVFKNQTIATEQYLVLPRSETKLALKNTDEKISLFDPAGRRVQEPQFLGTAPEGKSFNLIGDRFVFGNPSPGRANETPKLTANVNQNIPFNQPLHSGAGFGTIIALGLGAALLLSVFITILLRKDESASHIFFGRN